MKRISLFVILILTLSACSKKSGELIQEINNFRHVRSLALMEGERAPLNTEEVKMLKYYQVDKAFKCNCLFQKFDVIKVIEMPTYAGTTTAYKPYGKVYCNIISDSISLTVFQLVNTSPVYADKLFLPFKDETNGEESYGGGRYIDLSLKDLKNDVLTVDFNKAYNPLCAYKAGFRCPIPPLENHLKLKIEAGEKIFSP